jgi:hypothetical protein
MNFLKNPAMAAILGEIHDSVKSRVKVPQKIAREVS